VRGSLRDDTPLRVMIVAPRIAGDVPFRHPGRSRVARRPLPAWLRDAEHVDVAVYAAITQTPTPSLDQAMRLLTQAADYFRLWLGSAAILALTRGARGRRAAVTGLASVAVSSAVANLVLKRLVGRRRPDTAHLRLHRSR
jgi:undecaprenyl-diphosphatase